MFWKAFRPFGNNSCSFGFLFWRLENRVCLLEAILPSGRIVGLVEAILAFWKPSWVFISETILFLLEVILLLTTLAFWKSFGILKAILASRVN